VGRLREDVLEVIYKRVMKEFSGEGQFVKRLNKLGIVLKKLKTKKKKKLL